MFKLSAISDKFSPVRYLVKIFFCLSVIFTSFSNAIFKNYLPVGTIALRFDALLSVVNPGIVGGRT